MQGARLAITVVTMEICSSLLYCEPFLANTPSRYPLPNSLDLEMVQLQDQGLAAPSPVAVPDWGDDIQLAERSQRNYHDCEAGPMDGQTSNPVTATSTSSHNRLSTRIPGTGLRYRRKASPHERSSEGRSGGLLDYFGSRRDRTGADYCLFVSWSAGKEYEVIDLLVRDPEDETEVYRQIRKEWYKRKGFWKRLGGLMDVTSIQRATVRGHIVGT